MDEKLESFVDSVKMRSSSHTRDEDNFENPFGD